MLEQKALAHALIGLVDPVGRGKVFIWRTVGPARRVILQSKKGDPITRVTLLAEPTSCFSCKQLPIFLRKYRKNWITRDSSGAGRVTILPGTI